MAKQYNHIAEDIKEFIKAQKMYFVATAAESGTINLSPKGMDSFRVINKNKIVWLNLTGSGNETAAHLLKNDRMTIMFCSFEKKPLILRLYGHARTFHPRDSEYKEYLPLFEKYTGARQIIEMDIHLVQTSCGFAVPFMDFKSERNVLTKWADDKGRDDIRAYWVEKNTKSIDGYETEILE